MLSVNLSSIIEKQPNSNIGFVGHVAHGKSTVVKILTNVRTQKSSQELERNCTINLGYANLRIYRNHLTGQFIHSYDELIDPNLKLFKHYSIVDCPGHQSYMATMMSGTETIDIALVLIAANESIPQPQTLAHTNILSNTDIKHIGIIFNKIDLIINEQMLNEKMSELKNFVKSNKKLEAVEIIPISAAEKINTQQIVNFLAMIPNTNIISMINKPFKMNILRSFNVNKINVDIESLLGGVIGGSISSGHISVGDWVMIKPGFVIVKKDKVICKPIFCQVKTIKTETTYLDTAYPGGLIALGLDCDPSICRNDNLLGNRIYKLDKSNLENVVGALDITMEFSIKIQYLKPYTNYVKIKKIIILINGLPIEGLIQSMGTIDVDTNNIATSILHVKVNKPFAFDDSIIPVMHKINPSAPIDLFANGRIIVSHRKILMSLPSEINEIYNWLSDYKKINIIDDVGINIESNTSTTSEYDDNTNNLIDDLNNEMSNNINDAIDIELMKNKTIDNLRKQIQELTLNVTHDAIYQMKLPEYNFITEQTRTIWTNIQIVIDKFDLSKNSDLKIKIDDSQIRWQCFGQMLIRYMNYVYKKDDGCAHMTDKRLIIAIKSNTKNKPKKVITDFINANYYCTGCESITCRIGKIGSQYMSICVWCNTRKNVDNLMN